MQTNNKKFVMPFRVKTYLLVFVALLTLTACITQSNLDIDSDNITDSQDNCPLEANPQQLDLDQDNIGDICDSDIDGDGYSNEQETIAKTDFKDPNSIPLTSLDTDRDGITDYLDKCPNTKIGRRVDDFGCDQKSAKLTDNYSDEIKLNPPKTEPMLPKWALGYMQSGWGEGNNGYGSQQNFLDHAKALRGLNNQYGDHKHPADIMVLDMYWTGKEWSWPGNMSWDYIAFPNPKKMIDELHHLNFKIMLNYHEGGFGPDWLKKLQRDLDLGVDIVWLDFWRGDSNYEKQVWQLLKEYHGNNKRIVFMARHYARPNHYNQEAILGGDYMRKPDEQELEKSMPFHWTGDVLGNWQGLQESIDAIVYSEEGAMGGWSYLHSDTPGHTMGEDPELAIRWIQFSDFTTGTRNHGTTPRDVWSWGPEIERYSYFSRMLRYRLLPYIYTYTWTIWDKAIPLTRPMKLAYPGQADDKKYQYMFGKELLVAPVYQAATEFPNEKLPVFLPAGEDWINYWTHQVHQGGQEVLVPVGKKHLKHMPLFVKRGAIIPMGPEIFHIDPAKHADPLTLDIYPKPDTQTSFTLYDDDGESLEYQRGSYATTEITMMALDKGLTVDIGETVGSYRQKPEQQNYILKINLQDQPVIEVTLNEQFISNSDSIDDINDLGTKPCWYHNQIDNILYIKLTTKVGNENKISVQY
jgi:alpha-glucosidase (family GH31 glycosyl hydrolase)